MGILSRAIVVASLGLLLVTKTSAQAFRRNGDSSFEVDVPDSRAPLPPPACDDEFRSFDGTCTNLANRLLGSANRAQQLPEGVSTVEPVRDGLPSGRDISNAVCTQSEEILSARGLSELVTFFGQFIDHNLVLTPAGDETKNIAVDPSDVVFANFTEGLPFIRSERTFFESGLEGPVNVLTSALDLSAVYGSDPARANFLRELVGGRMLVSEGENLPFNRAPFLDNAPAATEDFFVAGDTRPNEHPVLTTMHTIWLREHNRVARKLEATFPDWDDETLYQTARKINGAEFQKVVYEEFIPAMTGQTLSPFTGHDDTVDITVGAIFSTAGFRLGHTMVGPVVNRVGPNGASMTPLALADSFFVADNIIRDGVDVYLRGAANFRAQETDNFVQSNLRNFLFTAIEEEIGFDLAAVNIQRGRDHGLPSFNEVRSMFGLAPYGDFTEVNENPSTQSALASIYSTVDDIDPWVGMISETLEEGASMGPTMKAIWMDQFTRLRDGDRFFYEIPDQFSTEVLDACSEVRDLSSEPETFKRILLENSGVTEEELPFSPSGIFFTGAVDAFPSPTDAAPIPTDSFPSPTDEF